MTQNGCGAADVGFHGALDGNHLFGRIDQGSDASRYHFDVDATAGGTASGGLLELGLGNGTKARGIPGGTMHLHR